jgi:3-oxoadipate enol-lactonase
VVAALVTGTGSPVTVFAHGLGASVAETRPLAGGVPGTRVLYAARGHGDSPLGDSSYDYESLGEDLLQVADRHGATQALGVSMGAGALLSLLSRQPDRFERVVLFLPAALDRPRTDEAVSRMRALADAIGAGDDDAVHRWVLAELPPDVAQTPAGSSYALTRARFLVSSPGIATAIGALPDVVPVRDRTALAAVTADVLVLAQEGDPLHPAQVARELVGLLPRARLAVFDRPGVVFRERARLRSLVVAHLTPG